MTIHRAKKRLGQHFLHDPFVIERIARLASDQPQATVVEIGPGQGALTRPLLARLGKLHVVELDEDVIPQLLANCQTLGDLHLHKANALRFDFAQLAPAGEKLRLIGNLPYNISTPLLFHLFKQIGSVQDMHFMLQKEVVDRLVAPPGSKRYGRLSVMTALYCKADALFEISPGAFNPPPKVDSAIVRLLPHSQAPVKIEDRQQFAQIVNQAFCHRRKTLRKIFRKQIDATQWQAMDINPQARPETLDLSGFARIANYCTESN